MRIPRRSGASGRFAAGNTDSRGLFLCEGKTGITGEAVAQVAVTDDAGTFVCQRTSEFYVPGDMRMWSSAGATMIAWTCVAEQPEYQPGGDRALPGADAV